MKSLIAVIVTILSLSAQADSIRSQCENYHYATENVALHQYSVSVDWNRMPNHNIVKLENIIFDNFDVTEKDYDGRTVYTIKENGSTDARGYAILLKELESIVSRVSCSWVFD